MKILWEHGELLQIVVLQHKTGKGFTTQSWVSIAIELIKIYHLQNKGKKINEFVGI